MYNITKDDFVTLYKTPWSPRRAEACSRCAGQERRHRRGEERRRDEESTQRESFGVQQQLQGKPQHTRAANFALLFPSPLKEERISTAEGSQNVLLSKLEGDA
jgi:hypothetical protein